MMPTQVEVVELSGPALDWVKSALVVQLVLGLVVVLLLAVLVVRGNWR